MNAEQKQQAKQLIADWTNVSKTSTPAVWFLNGDCMAGFLQELVDAPEPEPFGYFKSEPFGWTDCAETDDGAIALYTAPSEPKPVARVTGYYAGYLSIATVDGRVLPAGTALYAAPPAPSVPDEQLQAAFDRGLKAGNEQKDEQQLEIHRLNDLLATMHDLLANAPEPEPVAKVMHVDGLHSNNLLDCDLPTGTLLYSAPPAPSVPDGLQTIPSHDQLTKILNGLDRCVSAESRREFLRVWIRDWTVYKLAAAPTPAEAPVDVARDAERLDWLDERNAPHGLGWEIIQMPAGNVHIHTLTGDKAKFGSIRDAIDAAIERQGGES